VGLWELDRWAEGHRHTHSLGDPKVGTQTTMTQVLVWEGGAGRVGCPDQVALDHPLITCQERSSCSSSDTRGEAMGAGSAPSLAWVSTSLKARVCQHCLLYIYVQIYILDVYVGVCFLILACHSSTNGNHIMFPFWYFCEDLLL
jgi:hypothetical protein